MAFKWDVNLGHMLIAAPLVIGGTAYLVTDHNAVQTLTASVQQLRSDMTAQFVSVHADLVNLPDARAQLTQEDRRITDLENHSRDVDSKIGDLATRVGTMEKLQPYRNPPK